ncbi:hypothetical protein BD626DRAFT_521862 [Schizophyllum amplum]|uniref:Uncharacterized protein n=1 Tax=Schizophyllum amplum TaxID=97359 RepID=A0A550BTL1_9AGAR|nr:hypothetical protein BD626DRAFT_521862 [Auriculariopsis ampla]
MGMMLDGGHDIVGWAGDGREGGRRARRQRGRRADCGMGRRHYVGGRGVVDRTRAGGGGGASNERASGSIVVEQSRGGVDRSWCGRRAVVNWTLVREGVNRALARRVDWTRETRRLDASDVLAGRERRVGRTRYTRLPDARQPSIGRETPVYWTQEGHRPDARDVSSVDAPCFLSLQPILVDAAKLLSAKTPPPAIYKDSPGFPSTWTSPPFPSTSRTTTEISDSPSFLSTSETPPGFH